ncbi:MAG: pyridoxal-phosphate dependent enzyme [Pseudomonadota bacterium]
MRSISLDQIKSARAHIDPIFLNTPCLRRTSLDELVGCEIGLKVECLNPIRSFKGRGVDWFVGQHPGETELLCASAGNFGQALAYCGRERNARVVVFAAENANPDKISAMERLGAEVTLFGADFDAAKRAARDYALANGVPLIEDGAIVEIAEGAGTIALELLEQFEAPEVVYVPLGNGALLGGIACVLQKVSGTTCVVGVTATNAPAMKQSFDSDCLIVSKQADTIADGIAVREPVEYALEQLRGRLERVVAINDDEILEAMRVCKRHLGLIVEPAGAIGLAAMMRESDRLRGRRVATVLCGSNVDPRLSF